MGDTDQKQMTTVQQPGSTKGVRYNGKIGFHAAFTNLSQEPVPKHTTSLIFAMLRSTKHNPEELQHPKLSSSYTLRDVFATPVF